MRYNASADAAYLVAPMQAWAQNGFWVGLWDGTWGRYGVYGPRAASPHYGVSLPAFLEARPSLRFHESFNASVGLDDEIDEGEIDKRLTYAADMQSCLHTAERHAVDRRHRLVLKGFFVRFGLQLGFLAAAMGLVYAASSGVYPFEHAEGLVVVAFIVAIVVAIQGHRAINRKDAILYDRAFGPDAREVILPWEADRASDTEAAAPADKLENRTAAV